MKFTITYFRINVLLGLLVAINLVNFAVSKFYWPSLPAFPALIDGYPALSLLQAVVVAIGIGLQFWLRERPKYSVARMVVYAVTVGIALASMFEVLDISLRAARPS